ncbi:hypothetical protein DSO57_1036588 [Entomophthora muscae]|uniref:Uncharacterized protein n=1 Tax=Entomophthora muscae TaxID=34485 RepID=A0ACC2UJT8_9FUNG|nr:hypothetical protein DSO57_1036588 [Entomophthora muscae]
MFPLLFILTFLPSSEPSHCRHPEVTTVTRRAELSHLNVLLNADIEGDSPKPAPIEIVRTLEKYIPYARLSYCPDDSIKKMSCNHCINAASKSTPQFHSITSDLATKTHAVILVDKGQKEIIVSFRGSDKNFDVHSLAVVVTDRYAIDGTNDARVNRRVLVDLNEIIGSITDKLTSLTERYTDFVIILVGRSLGGCLATLAAPVLYKKLSLTSNRMLVMLYDQPKVANQVFVNSFDKLGFPYMHIINENDWVSQPSEDPNLGRINNEIHFKDGTALQCRKHDTKCSILLTSSYQQNSDDDEIIHSNGC